MTVATSIGLSALIRIMNKKERFERNLETLHPNLEIISMDNFADKGVFKCSTHGTFMEIPRFVLKNGGCKTCHFISIVTHRFLDRFDYSKVEYVSKDEAVEIICKEHGSFHITPEYHIYGYICPKCPVIKEPNLTHRLKQ